MYENWICGIYYHHRMLPQYNWAYSGYWGLLGCIKFIGLS